MLFNPPAPPLLNHRPFGRPISHIYNKIASFVIRLVDWVVDLSSRRKFVAVIAVVVDAPSRAEVVDVPDEVSPV